MSSPAERVLTSIDRIRAVCGVDPAGALAACDRAASDIKELKLREAELAGQLKAFEAYFERSGLTSHHDQERRILLAQIEQDRRRQGDKLSDKNMESYAHAHPTYVGWIKAKGEERVRMADLQVQLARVRAELEGSWMAWRTADLRARLAQSVIGFERSAASL